MTVPAIRLLKQEGSVDGQATALRRAMSVRLLPLMGVVIIVIVGVTYSLLWAPVVRHTSAWVTPGDIWGTFRDAHIVGWGGEGIMYASNVAPLTGFISFPAMPVVLAPVAMLSGALRLSECLPFPIAHPTAWLLLGPVELAMGAVVLFPLDALARRLNLGGARRRALTCAEAALAWPVVAMWGHPEDLIALGLGIYGLMAFLDGRWRRGAICLGAAVAFQPLALLIVPIALARAPRGRLVRAGLMAALPSAILLLAPLVHATGTTVRVLVDQPTPPSVNHPTPWIHFARTLGAVGANNTHNGAVTMVAGGPGRLIAFALSVVLGIVVGRRKPNEQTIWWLAAVALALRCMFEPVMTPYYAVPALALALLLAASGSRRQVALAGTAAVVCVLMGYRSAGEWSYYVPVAAALVATVLASCPARLVPRARWASELPRKQGAPPPTPA